MVRVLMCHNFQEQKVFSDAYEPTSITCSVLRDLVFVATSDGAVFVYSLLEEGFPFVCQFPLLSPSIELVFSDFGNYLLTRETARKDRLGHCTARVYFNWLKWGESKSKANNKIKLLHVGFSFTQSYCLEPGALTAVEILSRFSVRGLACCPSSGNIAVATETTATVYRRCAECPFDFQRVYIVEPGFSIRKLTICEQFVAFTSASEVRVLRVTFGGETAPSTEQSSLKNGFNSETEQFLSKGVLSNSITQREVFDEQFVVWSFDQCSDTSSEQSSFWDNILASKEWSEDDLEDHHPTPSRVELPSINEEVPFIDYSEESCEVLGPVKVVYGHPLRVQGALSNVQDVTMLYRCFEADPMKLIELPELHSLQLVPFYGNECIGEDLKSSATDPATVPKLSGMMCFVSTPKKGFMYNVFSKTDFLSHCTYTCDTKMAAIEGTLLYAVTDQALETYTIPLYAAVAKNARANRSLDFSDKLEVNPTGINEMENSTDTSPDGGGRTLSGDCDSVCVTLADGMVSEDATVGERSEVVSEMEDTHQGLYPDFRFPVYDMDILQKPCPSPSSGLCMIGVHRFVGLYSILAAGKRILLLSDTTNSPSKRHRKNKKLSSENKTKDWTLHVLKAMDMEELYHKIESLTENLNADLRLLEEQHLILRAQFQVGCMSERKRNSLLVMLKDSVRNLGDYHARYAVEQVQEVILYYTMANLSIEDVLDQHIEGSIETDKIKDRKFGKGLECYLNDILFQKNQEKNCIHLPQVTADKVLYIYSNAAPSRLSILILRPLIDGYTPELAVKLLTKLKKTKSYSFTTEDHLALAIVYLKVCELEQASGELLNLPKDKLAEICVKHHYILYEKDEAMSPLGQLLRRRLPKVFIKTLVSLRFRGIMSLSNTINSLQGKECEIHENTHLLEYLELILNDRKGRTCFKEARKLLIKIYLEKLSQETAVQDREVLRSSYRLPRGQSGHFSKRFSWLDKLPPFNGRLLEPQECLLVKANISTGVSRGSRWFPDFSRSPTPQLAVSATKTRTPCTCCCCWDTLLKLQSLLCSRYCDKELGNFVLSSLIGRSLSGDISITLLCLPLIHEHDKAIESLLLIEPPVVLTYAKQFFGDCHIKWQCVLNVLTQRIRDGKESETTQNTYKEILRETLVILSTYTTPTVFLSLLPDDGNFAFFLPFLVESCQKNSARNLSIQITAKS